MTASSGLATRTATKAAVEEGVVPGGGVALIRAGKALKKMKLDVADQQHGVDIVARAIEEPLRQIANNAGMEGSVVVEEVKGMKGAMGFNAATGEYVDMLEAGILDPTKVVRTALQNAASVAGLILTTDAMVAEKPKKETKAPGTPGMGDMDYDF